MTLKLVRNRSMQNVIDKQPVQTELRKLELRECDYLRELHDLKKLVPEVVKKQESELRKYQMRRRMKKDV